MALKSIATQRRTSVSSLCRNGYRRKAIGSSKRAVGERKSFSVGCPLIKSIATNMILKTRQQEREEYLKRALKENEIQISGNRIIYINAKGSNSQKYSDKDPEEKVRAFIFAELIYRYQYKPEKIWIEEEVPKRPSGDYADITIKDPNDDKTTYLVVEVKKEGISDKEVAKAIQQGYGYANYFDAKYFLFDNNEPERRTALELRKPDGSKWGGKEYEKNRIADIPFKYGKVTQYNFIKGKLEHELKAADLKELESVFKKAHNILWEGGKRNPADAFNEMSKLIFTKNWDEKFTPINKPYRFQVGTHETKDDITKRIKEIYDEARRKEPKVFTEEIKAKDSKIFQVVRLLQHISLKDTDLDAKGRAFEQFMSDVFKEKLGQYFTRRELVNFTVQMLEPTEEDIIIDPASGSGGFLLYAMKIVRDLIHQKYGEHSKVEQEWIGNNIFGIEVNEQIARVAMMDMIIHDDGHTNIEEADALADFSEFDPRKDIKRSKYSMVLTNPPFGSDIKDEDVDYLDKYELGAKNNPRHRQLSEVLYLERCLDLIQPDHNDNRDNRRGGKIGIVLPDGILTNSSLWYVRQFIEEHAYILAVVSLPQFAFKKAGSGSKTSLVFFQKFNNAERQKFLKDKAKFLTQIVDEFEKNKKAFSKKLVKFIDDNGFGEKIDEKQKEPKIIKQLKELGELQKYENLQKNIRALELELEDLNNFNPDLEAHKEVMKKWDYSIFMTIAEHIGYDATGRPDKNELFTAQNGKVNKNDPNTILGQYQIYKQNPERYAGI